MKRKNKVKKLFPFLTSIFLFLLLFLATGCSENMKDEDVEQISVEYLRALSKMKLTGELDPAKIEEKLKSICEERGFTLKAYKKQIEKIGKSMVVMSDEDFKKIETSYVLAEKDIQEMIEEQAKLKIKDVKEFESELKARKNAKLKKICVLNGYKIVDYKIKKDELFKRILIYHKTIDKEIKDGLLDKSERAKKIEQMCQNYGYPFQEFIEMQKKQRIIEKILNDTNK